MVAIARVNAFPGQGLGSAATAQAVRVKTLAVDENFSPRLQPADDQASAESGQHDRVMGQAEQRDYRLM